MSNLRLFYIDNLRIFLIILVVLHHFSLTYGAPGSWYYNETEAGFPEVLVLTLFVAVNQAFFMGMFFFVSAYFIFPSLRRKGTGKFIKDRLIRLGIPMLFYYFILSPLTVFIRNRFIRHENVKLWDYIKNEIGTGFGPLWFVEALLLFTAVALLIAPVLDRLSFRLPGTNKILLAAVITGILQFIIRIWYPVGWSMNFTEFQLPFFVQYVFLFFLGIIAFKNNWLGAVSLRMGIRWLLFAQGLIFIALPLLFVLGDALNGAADAFTGGFYWQNLGYALWEQLVGFSVIIGLIGVSKKYFNSQNSIAKKLSESAYGVFIVHPPVIIGISAVFVSWQINPLLKFALLAPLALVSCFLTALLLKKLPLLKKIL